MIARLGARSAMIATRTFRVESRLQQPVRCFAQVISSFGFEFDNYLTNAQDRFKYDNAHQSNAEELIAKTDVILVDGPTAYCEGGTLLFFFTTLFNYLIMKRRRWRGSWPSGCIHSAE